MTVRLSAGLWLVLLVSACQSPTPSLNPMDGAARARTAGDWPAMMDAYQIGAEQGDPYAMLGAAEIFQSGIVRDSTGTAVATWTQDTERAQSLAQEAAERLRTLSEQNDAVAQTKLGEMLFSGIGVAQDTSAAARVWERAAENGNSNALYNLGWLVYRGRDDARAVATLRQAAENGQAQAQYAMYLAYRDGRGVGADSAEAMGWLTRSASSGLAFAVREQRSVERSL